MSRTIEMATRRAATNALLHRMQHGLPGPPVELVYAPHERWPIPQVPPAQRPLRVMVLDSSFNPPTLAHLALANTRRPSYSDEEWDATGAKDSPDYDAKLLLLSIRNVDKTLKPGDATYIQRLEMMELLAGDIASTGHNQGSQVGIAIINEPTFVAKSSKLRTFFKNRFNNLIQASLTPTIYDTQLTFLLGFDTLERLVQPRYYSSESRMLTSLRKFLSPSPDGDDSRVVCARRIFPTLAMSHNADASEHADLAPARQFIASKRIVIIDIDENVRTYSSSEVRKTISQRGLNTKEWRKFVPNDIAEYIIQENLYVGQS